MDDDGILIKLGPAVKVNLEITKLAELNLFLFIFKELLLKWIQNVVV